VLRLAPPATAILAAVAAIAGTASAAEAATYAYTFRITSVTLVSTYTLRGAQAVTTLHGDAPTPAREVSWTGVRSGERTKAPRIAFVGQAQYSSADPTCASTRPFHSLHPTQLYVTAGATALRIMVVRFPLSAMSDGVDNGSTDTSAPKCGASLFSFYDDANITVPLSELGKRSFTVTATRHTPDLGYGQGIDWTLTMTVQSVAFHLLKKK